jgi:hypothetical protein
MKRKVFAGTAAAIALGGAGAGIAATQFRSSPHEETQAVVSDAAKRLGVEPSALSSALKHALEDRVDAAVTAGRLSKAQGEELKQRIESNDFPLFATPLFFPGPGFHFHHGFPGLDAAASYLGLTESQLDQKLQSGKSLAQIAKDEGKSVDGLVGALKDDLESKLDDAVAAGRLSKSDEQRVLADVEQRIRNFVQMKFVRPPLPAFGFRDHRGFDDGPHAVFPGPFE